MKFPVLPVRSARDATLNFEKLQKELTEGLGKANFTKLVQEQLEPGSWELTTPSAKLEELAGFQLLRVRKELGGAVARLRGAAKVKAAQEIKAGETVLTLPSGFFPLATIDMAGITETGASVIKVTSAGVLTTTVNLKAGEAIVLDGCTFNLT